MNTDKIYAEAIANEYSVKETTKVVQLRKLDRKVKLVPNIFTYTWGIIATLIMGVGMCFALEVLMTGWAAMVIGCVVGVVGIIGIAVNYPIYKKMLNTRKAKYANDIITLANEISAAE